MVDLSEMLSIKAHQSRTRLCVVEIPVLVTDQEKQQFCECDKHAYINSFPEAMHLLAPRINIYHGEIKGSPSIQ